MSILDDLNPGQRAAATTTDPVVVVAGAGTGKTRVITYRVAWLISEGVRPDAILAVTFTNKAAREMKERIQKLVPQAGGTPWVGTFHAFCARLLRTDGPLIGIPRDFAIYDEEDQKSVIRQALRVLGHDERQFPPRSLREPISYAKNHGWDSERLAQESLDEKGRVAAAVWLEISDVVALNLARRFDALPKNLQTILDTDAGKAAAPAADVCAVAGWCTEHGVPEDICAQCNAKLAAEEVSRVRPADHPPPPARPVGETRAICPGRLV